MRSLALSLLAILFTPLQLNAQDQAVPATSIEDLGEFAENARREAGVPGLGLVVWHGDEEAPRCAAAGIRVAGFDAAVETGDAWHWGSITKSMTATLVARLVERDVISWNDTVSQRLSGRIPDMHEAYRNVTFKQLLSHHAGMPANIPIKRFAEFSQESDDPIADRLKWVRIALTQEPLSEPGTEYVYSNNGYIVAGAMLESATGKSWEALMRAQVFEPLGLIGAGFGPPRGESPTGQPRGHRPGDGEDTPVPEDADNPAALGPAGRVQMPLADIATYLRAHANRRVDFLSEESWETLHSPPFDGFYALGWIVTSLSGRWHNGSNTMWYAEVAFDLETHTVAAVVVNDGEIASVQPTVRETLGALMKSGPRFNKPNDPKENEEHHRPSWHGGTDADQVVDAAVSVPCDRDL